MKEAIRTIALWFFLCPSVSAQVYEIGIGSSTLEGVQGASVTTYLPNSTIVASVGRLSDGDVRYSLSYLFRWKGFDVTAGDSTFSFLAGLSGLGIAERGVAIERKTEKTKLDFFAGETGTLFQAPFAVTFGGTSAGAGVFAERKFQRVKLSTLEVIQGNKATALESAVFDWRSLRATATAGWLQGSRQFEAQAQWRPKPRLSLIASHSTYVLGATHSTIDEVSGSAGIGRVDGNLTAFHSSFGWGESAGAGVRPLDWLSIREAWAVAPSQRPLYLTTGLESFRHWTASQTYTRDGRGSWSFGGSYHSNRWSASVGQQILFNVTSGKFESATIASLQVHAGNISTNLATSINRAEHLYTASGTDFLGEPINAHGHDSQWIEHARFELSGRVTDPKGNAIEGAAVKVGSVIAYTDRTGTFLVRSKKQNAQPFQVLPSEFAAPGRWRVLTAPSTVYSGQEVEVVVTR